SFSLERVGKAGAKFDAEKTKWYNQQYLREKPNEFLAIEFENLLVKQGLNKGNIDLLQVVDLLKERATFVSDFMEGNYFFTIPKNPDLITLKKKQKPDSKETIEALVKRLSVLNNFTAE